MTNLAQEYTDTKAVTHNVEHLIVPSGDDTNKEQIVEAVLHALAKSGKTILA